MKPNFLNRFMKKLTRERVVPIISADFTRSLAGASVLDQFDYPPATIEWHGPSQ
jgi:hypothetical protein